MSEDKKQTIVIKRGANDKLKSVAEELAELLNVTKYQLTFFFMGEKLALNERLGDREIGISPWLKNSNHQHEDKYLLCLKGGNEGPRSWKRFTMIDDPCRQLSYIADEEAFDAISFVPKKDIQFAGFSVHPVASTDVDFKCIYKYKIGTESSQEQHAEFS